MSETHPLEPFVASEAKASDLAGKVGCSVSHLRNLRAGRKTASLPLAKKLSDATGLPMDAFMPGEREVVEE